MTDHTLDLHGERHSEVERLVQNFVLMKEGTLKIITGKSPRMQELTVRVLDKHDITWQYWGEGAILCG